MVTYSKRRKAIKEKVQPGKQYPVIEAISILKDCATPKFCESVDIAVNLGIDARKLNVRGATVLPHGTGRQVRVAVFAQGAQLQAAKDAGADVVGLEDLAETIKAGEINFDIVIAAPDTMQVVGRLGQILGPKGMMPNPKVGTVTMDVATAVKNAKGGQVQFRNDKNGIVQCSIGKVDFESKSLIENLEALLIDLKKAKPTAAKGTYLKKLTLSTTMGPGIQIDLTSLTI